MCFLSYDDEHHRIGIVNTGATEQPGPKTRGLEHFAFTYADITGLLHTYERLERAGITPFWSVNHGPTTSFYYRDPDGNHIELQVDNFVRNEDATSFMRSEVYNSNPIGVDVDPRELLRRLHAGECFGARESTLEREAARIRDRARGVLPLKGPVFN
ncbi:VOC family protein [Cystobacter fuscus]